MALVLHWPWWRAVVELVTRIAVAIMAPATLAEPMLFYLPFLQRPDARPNAEHRKVEHEAGLREITRLEMVSPSAKSLSPALAAVLSAYLIRMRTGKEYLVEVGFDGESLGRAADCRPALPLVLHW